MMNNEMKIEKISTFINISLAFLWIYQGLVPKILLISPEEIAVWQWFGFHEDLAKIMGQASGVAEVLFGLFFLIFPQKILHYLSILGLITLFFLIVFLIPDTLVRAFNPVVMNFSMIALSIIYLMLKKVQCTESSSI